MTRQDIGIIYPNNFPVDFESKYIAGIKDDRLNSFLQQQDSSGWEAIKWVIPGTIDTYIFKAYFDHFLEGAGNEHYILLKQCLRNLLKKNKVAFSKAEKNYASSKAILFHIELKNGRIMKLVFDNKIDVEDWQKSLDKMLDLVWKHYTNALQDELLERLPSSQNYASYGIYATINEQTKTWQFWNLQEMLKNEVV